MATNIFRVYRSGADIRGGCTAPAPSGGVYFAENELSALNPDTHLLRLSSTGGVVWSKRIDDSVSSTQYITSNSSRLALVMYGADAHIVMMDSSGTILWSTSLPFSSPVFNAPQFNAPPIALGPDNSLFVFGSGSDDIEAILTKLDASTGAITWSVNLRDSGGTDTAITGSLAVMSTGNVVVHMRGPNSYVLCLSGADGSQAWGKTVTWPSGNPETGVGVDPSDNVYIVGRPHLSGTRILPVVKFDSSGTALWNRQVVHASGLTSLALTYATWDGQLTCTSDGVYIRAAFGITDDSFGHVFVPASGTIAAGAALVATFDQIIGVGTGSRGSGGGSGLHNTLCYFDKPTVGSTYLDMMVVIAGKDASEDNYWNPRYRQTYAFDVAAGSATIGTASYTRASMPSFSASSFTPTVGSVNLLVDTFIPISAASSIAPATAFGTPARVAGTGVVNPYTISTAVGTPARTNTVSATAVVPAATFGTAVLVLNRTVAPAATDPALAFGLPVSKRSPVPRPIVTVASAASTAFGAAVATSRLLSAATGSSASTALGTPVLGLFARPSGFAGSALGTPRLVNLVSAKGAAAATTFGLPTKAGFGTAAALSPSTKFGRPSTRAPFVLAVAGLNSTAFGTPSCLRTSQRARSGVFRTQWGVGQAERTAP